jgi:hypothetical protein
MKRITHIGLLVALSTLLLISLAGAQTQAQSPDQPPLGDYARKVRKDPVTTKARPKVFDNDNLPTEDKLSVVGQKPPADAANAAPADNKDAAAPKPEDDQTKKQAEWKGWQNKLTAQKDSIDLAARELDVLQREYQLRAAAMYADAGNRIRNEAQWDKQDADYKQKIADKQKAVDDAKAKLDDMKEEARKAGVPSSMMPD